MKSDNQDQQEMARSERDQFSKRLDSQIEVMYEQLQKQEEECRAELSKVRVLQQEERSQWLKEITEMHLKTIKAMSELQSAISKMDCRYRDK